MPDQTTVMSTAEFFKVANVDAILTDLQQHFQQSGKPMNISDVRDEHGNQYVDLVQEGGGVLGIALVGYTFILEKMGIRFFSMAGTSAGSINAMLLACAGNKEDEKSYKIAGALNQLKMFSFVDGKPGRSAFNKLIKKFITRLLTGKNPAKKILNLVKIIAISLVSSVLATIALGFFWPVAAKWFGLVAFLVLIVVIILIMVVIKRFKEFSSNGYGLNKGEAFHVWIKQQIEACSIENDPAKGQIRNYANFTGHFMRVPALTVTTDDRRENNAAPHMPMLTIITCDIIAKRKIEFPQMWDLYWSKPEDVHPGDFVRASMSIPVFFESFCRDQIRTTSRFEIWDKHLNWQNEKKAIPDTSQFIDGGTLSNFPINVFYNPMYPVPRMPTFGIRLQDGVLDTANTNNKSFSRYLMSLFSTIRFNFDRDFITKNRAYTLGVKNIDVREHNWLNFFMEEKEKAILFEKGAKAASEFLKAFDWESYKTERLRNFKLSEERFNNPNNIPA
jgi:NTE family protein